jgi:hypothetical protein
LRRERAVNVDVFIAAALTKFRAAVAVINELVDRPTAPFGIFGRSVSNLLAHLIDH